ncbi:MAG: hypothetical protein NTV63_02400 [Candidatus Woesearchaeota archaeon]|nr:hypothetical protein [Candidatus Woesearchaeota archaeon]
MEEQTLTDEQIARESFSELYPGKEMDFVPSIVYTGKIKDYNASIMHYRLEKRLVFRLGKKWIGISPEIKKGLFQELMVKMLSRKKKFTGTTINMELYNIFIKKLHISIPKTKSEPLLSESFDRVNEKYFSGLLEKPNLAFGGSSFRKLASYNYQNDTICVSSIFQECSPEMLDYLMYHEMLHKRMKFSYKNGKNYHHTRIFRQMEREFADSEIIEKALQDYVRKKKTENRISEREKRGFLRTLFDFR